MTLIIALIIATVAVPSRFDDNRYFQKMATMEYDKRILDKYVQDTCRDLRYKAQCYGHSIELIRRLRKDGEYCVLMGYIDVPKAVKLTMPERQVDNVQYA